ncbi:MAG: extracellular solute-binding protein [Ruminococcaceae bacterium]|nr:extracellular solute-binding protein [Oscillospiraceae bacterium]
MVILRKDKAMRNYRIIALLLAVICLSGSLVACGGAGGGETTPAVTDPADTTVPEETEPPVTEERPDLPENLDYDDYEFMILSAGNVAYKDFGFTEEAGTVVEAAQHQRQLMAEEKLGIVIHEDVQVSKSYGNGTGYNKIRSAVVANEQIYDLGIIAGYDVTELASGNYLFDLNSLPNVNTQKSWWDQNANNDLAVNGLLFFTNGELSGARAEATFVIYYNKAIGETKGLTAPYQLVEDGKWTVDVLAEMARTVSEDLNGDDVIDTSDRFGIYVWKDAILGMIAAAGSKCATIQEDGTIALTLYNDNSLAMFEKFTSIAYDKNYACQYQNFSGFDVKKAWVNDQALFWATSTINTALMRSMDSDFGILPFPKLSEEQDRYYSTIGPFNSQFICAPLILDDEERTGAIIETLAYLGQTTLTPALYEKNLKGISVRDEDSAAMLDIIFDSYIYDVGYYYQIGNYNENIMNVFRAYGNHFTSMYNQFERSANLKLKLVNQNFAEVLDDWKK